MANATKTASKTAPRYVDVEAWIIVDENGEYAVGADLDTAGDAYADVSEGTATARRTVRLTVRVALPATVTVDAGVVEAEDQGAEVRS